LRYCLEALYPFAHEIIVVEGACLPARSLATSDGHSTDGTVEMLKRFKAENDPDNKLLLVFGEDDGKPDGFWSEKDEMSQAYARKATGDWLWQVDYDEFYLESNMRTMLEMLASDPDITAVSFPYRQFWGGFDYVETGQWFKYEHPCFHRLFRWGPGYRYVKHRPPTVVDEKGRDLRTQKWITHRQMRRAGIYLYHYSYVLPKQAREKVGYYRGVTWSDEFQDIEQWLNERYLELGDPYHVGEGMDYLTWLERYQGPHPGQILKMKGDIANGHLVVSQRPTEDIESSLVSPSYVLGTFLLRGFLFLKWYLWTLPLRTAIRLAHKGLDISGFSRLWRRLTFLKRRGFLYWQIRGYAEIPGWLTEDEALTLHDLALSLPSSHPVVVEIGSFLGQSSLVLAKGIKRKLEPILYCIDPFNADGDPYSKELYAKMTARLGLPLKEQFIKNLKKNRLYDLIRLLVGYSTDLATDFKDKIDLLFIDGNHEYDAVLRDYEDWTQLLKVGGTVVFHDVVFDPVGDDFPGPGQVVEQYILDNPKWSEIKLVDSLFMAKKVAN